MKNKNYNNKNNTNYIDNSNFYEPFRLPIRSQRTIS